MTTAESSETTQNTRNHQRHYPRSSKPALILPKIHFDPSLRPVPRPVVRSHRARSRHRASFWISRAKIFENEKRSHGCWWLKNTLASLVNQSNEFVLFIFCSVSVGEASDVPLDRLVEDLRHRCWALASDLLLGLPDRLQP